jgi:uncharacterized membrane protein YedE/YeeE
MSPPTAIAAATIQAPGPAAASLPRPRRTAVILAGLGLALLSLFLAQGFGWPQSALFAIGGLFGLTLFHAAFGFASSWRAFVRDGRGHGLRVQMLMLALASLAFLPILDQGTLFGRPVVGAIAPAGVSVLVGAFMFGIGMQLGGGCGSGTLYTAGSGNIRMMITLLFFITGATVATLHVPWWYALPSLETSSVPDALGVWPAVAAQLVAFAAIALLTVRVERRRHGALGVPAPVAKSWRERLLRGPWPLVAGAMALVILNLATLAIAGHPWNVTFAFGLWGAKSLAAIGVDVAAWEFWTWPFPAQSLGASVFADVTSVMDFGVLLGAFLAAALAGRVAPSWRIDGRSLAAAIIGGLLMGYGARLAFGCNIGAFFSGIASGSLHGWLWFAAAMIGTWAGTGLRPLFALDPGRPPR